jgi:MFS family permease
MNPKKARIPFTLIMLGLVSFFTDAATEMIYPLLPVFVVALGSGAVALGVIEGVAETTAALLKLLSGIISDAVKKRKLLVLIGYGISSLVRPFTGLVDSAWQIVAVRMADRVGKGIRTAPRDALIAANVDESIRGKSYGFHRAMDHAGAVVGPLLAILTLAIVFVAAGVKDLAFGLRITFFAAAVPGLFALLTLIFFVKEKPIPDTGKKLSLTLRGFDRNFFIYLGIVLLFTLGNSSDAFLLYRAAETVEHSSALVNLVRAVPVLQSIVSAFGNPSAQAKAMSIIFLPVLWAFFHLIKVIFSTPLGTLSDRIGRKKVIIAGWCIYAAVYTGFAFLDILSPSLQIIATFTLFAVYALFYAFTEGAEKALVADLVSEEKRGSAFGLFNFSVGLGALPASIIFGVLYSTFGPPIAFGTGAILSLAAMFLMAFFVKESYRKVK